MRVLLKKQLFQAETEIETIKVDKIKDLKETNLNFKTQLNLQNSTRKER